MFLVLKQKSKNKKVWNELSNILVSYLNEKAQSLWYITLTKVTDNEEFCGLPSYN